MRYQLTKNLYLDEYMPDEIYRKFGQKCIRLLDKTQVNIDQKLRERYGAIFINIPGLQYRGFRPYSYYLKRGKIYSQSQHKYGRGSDKHFKGISVDEVYKDILKNQKEWFKIGLTTMESIDFTHRNKDKLGWLHTDCRYPEPIYNDIIRIVFP